VAGQKIDGVALGAAATGALFLYAGVKGYSIPHGLQQLVQGKKLSGVANPITTSSGQSGAAGGGNPVNVPGGAGSYDHSQLMSLWVMAGGSQAEANNAACHGMQESSGDPKALNVNGPGPGCDAVGLWQLATPCGKGAGYTVAQLQDPITNARVTVKATNDGQDWSAWSTPGC
jgi:lysozyme-like protein